MTYGQVQGAATTMLHRQRQAVAAAGATSSVAMALAARTQREDPQFTLAIDKNTAGELRQPTERTWFELDKTKDSGYARVTTLSFEVETPNLFRGN